MKYCTLQSPITFDFDAYRLIFFLNLDQLNKRKHNENVSTKREAHRNKMRLASVSETHTLDLYFHFDFMYCNSEKTTSTFIFDDANTNFYPRYFFFACHRNVTELMHILMKLSKTQIY